jgi:hypothetical protein
MQTSPSHHRPPTALRAAQWVGAAAVSAATIYIGVYLWIDMLAAIFYLPFVLFAVLIVSAVAMAKRSTRPALRWTALIVGTATAVLLFVTLAFIVSFLTMDWNITW